MVKTMAKRRSAKNKERSDTSEIRIVGIRVSVAYAEWLESVAKLDKRTVSSFAEMAFWDRARALGAPPPPDRIS